MNTLETQQLIIILSMLTVNMIKTIGMYYVKRRQDGLSGETARGFDYSYVVSALLGVFMAYVAFGNTGAINTSSFIDTFMQAGYYSLTSTFLFDFSGRLSK